LCVHRHFYAATMCAQFDILTCFFKKQNKRKTGDHMFILFNTGIYFYTINLIEKAATSAVFWVQKTRNVFFYVAYNY
jgi:hypothetical protein